ncbi:MAG: Arginine/lysine/ornithine decarboxylase [Herbinix sp.]|nr:Arginine/lysine/ornithine decarboxylase [Herbinix sp.]
MLYNKLLEYSKEDDYPMHMPGHKRNCDLIGMVNPYEIDITEIDGFDNLHHPEGVLRKLSERIAALYGAKRSFPLINGSTAGNLAGIAAATKRRDKVLVARNAHKSIYHGLMLRDLNPMYLYPEIIPQYSIHGGILPEKIEAMLINHPDISLVVITSPTYEGVLSDVGAIAKIVHRYGARLMVDEAHGAHLGFHKEFPESAVHQGADIVIQSFHKTLPSLTQTAVLHCNDLTLTSDLERFLGIYQSSSPSYVLMASIDLCTSLLEEKGEGLFDEFHQNLEHFYASIEGLNNLTVLKKSIVGSYGIYDLDPSKVTILTAGTTRTGHEIAGLLKQKYHIVPEMDSYDYLLCMTTIGDKKDGLERLSSALMEIDRELEQEVFLEELAQPCKTLQSGINLEGSVQIPPEQAALEQKMEQVALSESCGKIVGSFVSCYPPGIPIILPGEVMTEELIDSIIKAKATGLNLLGLSGKNEEEIAVIGRG